jgi:hypothetical protein
VSGNNIRKFPSIPLEVIPKVDGDKHHFVRLQEGVESYSSCLLARDGEEHRHAARRRVWVMREDERMEEASRVHWLANVRRGEGVSTAYWIILKF